MEAPDPPTLHRWLLTVLVAIIGGLPFAAIGQSPALQEGSQGEVAIRCEWFGVGNKARIGEWTGIQLRVNDSNDRPREVLIRIATQDPDGDKPLWETTLTTNPGVNQPVWTYLRLPATFRASDPLRAFVYAAVEGPPIAPGLPPTPTAGRQLGSTVFQSQRLLAPSEGMIGIVGNRNMGLRRYGGEPNLTSLPLGHERWEFTDRLDPETLPDRWMGLMPFAALIWNEPPPSALGTERSQAIREWVTRGGHLIVVLPRLAQTWTDEASNPLHDIVPRVSVRRRESFDLEPLRPLITHLPKEAADARNRLELPSNEVIQTFRPLLGALSSEAFGVIAMPSPDADGRTEWLVVRRLVGQGMVTLIGLDAASRWMEQRALPDPELFWHRILGRRGQMVSRESGDPAGSVSLPRRPITVDNGIADQIAKTTLAGAGVLLGLVVFVVYWLAAGPLGYAALKKTGRQRHAWSAFVLASGLFTAVAWGGASFLRPARTSAEHFSILDHVYSPEGQSVQRARAWLSVLIPQYGDASLSIGEPGRPGTRRFTNLLAPWEQDRQSSAGFPDARSYRIPSRTPDSYTIPTRSTVKQFQADWAGGPTWKMPSPRADTAGNTIPLTAQRVDLPGGQAGVSLSGSLTHELPADIAEFQLIVSLGQRPISRSLSGRAAWRMSSEVFAANLTGWKPGVPLDLSAIPANRFSRADGTVQGANPGYFGTLVRDLDPLADGIEGSAGATGLTAMIRKMYALSFMGQLEPPAPEDRSSTYQPRPLVRRSATHGWDLSHWLTQPCIIIVGVLGPEKTPSPVPLKISDGGTYRDVPTEGLTFVRWVYPLPPRPPAWGSASDPIPEPSPSPDLDPE